MQTLQSDKYFNHLGEFYFIFERHLWYESEDQVDSFDEKLGIKNIMHAVYL
jgi:hypothetical protein